MYSVGRVLSIILVTFVFSSGFWLTPYANAADFKVAIKHGTQSFAPQVTRVKLGEIVRWVNESEEDHYLTSAGLSTRRVVQGTGDLEIHQLLVPGSKYSHSFTEPGIYHYFCAIHTEMWGTVVVEE